MFECRRALKPRYGRQAPKFAAWLLLGCAPVLYPGTVALAQQSSLAPPGAPEPAKEDWTVLAGGGALWTPKFEGAKAYRIIPIPVIMASYKDIAFVGPMGLGVNAFRSKNFRAGVIAGAGIGRYQDDDPHLRGLGDIDPSASLGMFATYDIGFFQVNAVVQQTVTDVSQGLQGRINALFRLPLFNDKLFIEAGPEVGFADYAYEQTYFGVSQAQSLKSGLPAYSPGGGLKDYGASASLTYCITDQIVARVMGAVHQLEGDAAKSPIVQNKTQSLVGFGLAYKF